jgi:hypothetical protein
MDCPEASNEDPDELATWNERRREFARLTGLPFIPVKSDREAPPVDEDLIRRLIAEELPAAEAERVMCYCWWYPSWIRAAARLGIERLWTDPLLRKPQVPPELG